MAGPAPAPSPGARGALRLAAEAALLLVAGFLVGYLVPAGGAAVPPSSPSTGGAARPPAAPTPTPTHPAPSAARPETGASRDGVPASGAAAAPAETPPPPGDSPPLLPGDPPTAGSPGTASLRVRVVDATGAPVAGAAVETLVFRNSQPQDRQHAETDARGIADFAGLAPGARRVNVRAKDLSAECNPSPEAGRTTEVLIPVEAPVTFRGVVRHAAKGPLAGVRVNLHRWEGPLNSSASTTSGPGGAFRFETLPAGPWGVWLQGGEFGPSQQVGMVLVPDGGLERDIVVGRVLLSGTVTEKGSLVPVPGVRISMTTGGVRDPVVTDAAGSYRHLDLPPGLYGFQVSREGYGIRWIRGVEVPEEGRKFDIEMTPAAPLTLHVTKADGGPYAGSLILIADPKDPENGTRVSTGLVIDATGTGTYRQVVPGAYTFRFRMPGVGEAAVIEAEVPAGGATLDVRIAGK